MSAEFAARRQKVLAQLSDACLVIGAAPVALRNNDIEHEYRQDSDFYYLTGFDEPQSVLVLRQTEPRFVLFVRPKDPEREVWDGYRAGVEGAVKQHGADEAYPIAELATRLPDLLENHSRLVTPFGRDAELDARVTDALAALRKRVKQRKWWPTELVDPAGLLHRMRLHKSPAELELMRKAARISADAHLAAMKHTRPGGWEYEVEALLRSQFRKAGAERLAYECIVGSGPNATVLHYRKNDRQMGDGELLLIDAGCEFGYYASDITRTFPVNGRFSAPQQELYEVVLAAQLASIDAARVGNTLDAVHQASVKVLTQGMVDAGLIAGPVDEAIETERFKKYYMHRTSHYLGMDVHDVGDYYVRGEPNPLTASEVITVEPGLYVSEADADAPERFRGIGIRIEDDVVITSEGPEVISAGAPKSVDEVQRACQG
ncbi:MAG: aminopeptidase P N-terminal domain-containing protein [Polyangiaceae bacterium]